MWSREQIKEQAKMKMRGRYFTYLGGSLLPVLVSFVVNIPVVIIIYIGMFSSTLLLITSSDTSVSAFGIIIFIGSYIGTFVLSLAATFFGVMPSLIGYIKWAIRSRDNNKIPVSTVFSTYAKGNYLKIVGSVAYYTLFIYLWSLLFIIPGIVKAYSYSMAPFILAENPGIGAKRAIVLSDKMTQGEKMNIFVLDLSFLGWMFLGLLACGYGVYAVYPYMIATRVELYEILKKNAIEKGYCTPDELKSSAVSPIHAA